MRGSDGATATSQFQCLSVFRGHGVVIFSRGSMSFAYATAAEALRRCLKVPEGRRVMGDGSGLERVEQPEIAPRVR